MQCIKHLVYAMSSFKLYLPSNACPEVYPNNTPTDFRTAFNKPLVLEGQWEVGLESISYSPQIHDDTQRAHMLLKVGKAKRALLNDEYAYHYRLNVDNSWPGYNGVIPPVFESDPNKIDNVLNTLNSLNDQMLTSGTAFHFRYHFVRDVVFEPYDENLFIRLTPRLASVLGFRHLNTMGRHEFSSPFVRNAAKGTLTQEDYRVCYLNTYLQREETFTLKWNNTPFDGKKNTFLGMWRSAIPYKVDVAIKDKTLSVTKHDETIAIEFSHSLQRACHRTMPIIGKDANVGTKALQFDKKNDFTNDHWYVTVYRTDMSTVRHYIYRDIPLSLMPWRSNTIRELLHTINRKVAKTLKRKLMRSYHQGRHLFSLKLQTSQHVKLTLGKRLEVEFSPKLAHLLGFSQDRLQRREIIAPREVDALFNRARQLHVLTNIIQPTAVGNQQVQILRDFVHQSTQENMSVKYFDTISYIPLRINRIDSIHMQLVNDMMETVKIKDAKTLITLYFRKV